VTALVALLLPGLSGSPAAAPKVQPKSGAPPVVGLIVLPDKGTDRATAREVRTALLAALRTDREVQLVDTARRLSRQPARLDAKERRLLQEGVFAIDARRPRQAIAQLTRALKLMRTHLHRVPKRALADAQLHLAAAELHARRRRRAKRLLLELLVWRARALPKLRCRAPRGWQKVLRWARKTHSALPSGSLRVTSVPSGAATFVDGRRTGATPAVISNLTVGAHYLTVRLAGYRKVVLAATVRPQEQTVAVNLRRAEEAHELLSMLGDMRPELGRKRVLFPAALRDELGLAQTLLVLVSKRPTGLSLKAHLYTLDSGELRGSATAKTARPPREPQLLALALWRTTQATARPRVAVTSGAPIYKRWWFWALVGGAAAAGVIVPLVLTSSTDTVPTDRFRISW
jgi:hypothetical protein